MPTKKFSKDLDFLYEIGSIRHLVRTWTQFVRSDVANVTEHIYRVIWIALVIAKHEKNVNTEKLMKMALVHDITESRTGDAHYLSRQYVERREEMAIDDIMKDTSLDEEFINLWNEYEKKESIEAKIVKDADNLDVDLELNELPIDKRLRAGFQHIRAQAIHKKFYTKTAEKMWLEIQSSNPHDWHLKGRNRFVAGDWKKK